MEGNKNEDLDIINGYEQYLLEEFNNNRSQENNLGVFLTNKKIYLKDTDLCFEKTEEYYEGTEKKTFTSHEGKCLRQKFFDISQNAPEDKELVKLIQINNNMKNEFLYYLKKNRKLISDKESYSLSFKNVVITGDVAIYNNKGKNNLLIFESIKNNYFVKTKPVIRHILKALPAMIYFKFPLTLVYQDRGTLEINKFEISFGNDFEILIDGVLLKDFNLYDVIKEMDKLYDNIIEEKAIPARSYNMFDKRDLFILGRKNIINKNQSNEIFAGLKVFPFDCQKCKYKNLCDNLPSTLVKQG